MFKTGGWKDMYMEVHIANQTATMQPRFWNMLQLSVQKTSDSMWAVGGASEADAETEITDWSALAFQQTSIKLGLSGPLWTLYCCAFNCLHSG